MPFKECSIVSQREEFCRLASSPGANVRELSRRFGIGATTAYKWLGRYRALGSAGLLDRSRRPLASPSRTPAELEARVLALRKDHPAWGGRKLREALEQEGLVPPAASTITEILRRHGKLDGPGAEEPRDHVRFERPAPNDLWQMDFKGHFALAGRGRCHPLTVLDDHSRYSLEIGACANEQEGTVRARLAATFRRYGLPRQVLADNGPPWGTAGPERHTKLTVWLLDLDIGIIHGRAYHPQTQGKVERFHRSLQAEVLNGRSFIVLDETQHAFDTWREIYNTKRPHEALGMKVPASRYEPSCRSMPGTITPPDYGPQAIVRKIDQTGRFSFKSRMFRFSKAFAGRTIAMRPTATDGLFDLCYRSHVLAQVDLRQNVAESVHHVPEHPHTLCPI